MTMRSTNKAYLAGSSDWRRLGGLRVREVRYAGGARQDRHRHADASLSLVLAGEVEESSQNMTYRAAAGSLVVKPADCWHANVYGPRGAVLVQVVPENACELFAGSGWHYRWHDAPRLARSILRLLADESQAAELAELALWDALDELAPRTVRASAASHPRWWHEAVDLLDECSTQTVSVAAVARRVGVHPVHLARVCRQRFGCTVREYIRERRVLAAWRACERGDGSLATIAVRFGFADQPHMTRAFAQVLGTSPGRLRRLAATSAAVRAFA